MKGRLHERSKKVKCKPIIPWQGRSFTRDAETKTQTSDESNHSSPKNGFNINRRINLKNVATLDEIERRVKKATEVRKSKKWQECQKSKSGQNIPLWHIDFIRYLFPIESPAKK